MLLLLYAEKKVNNRGPQAWGEFKAFRATAQHSFSNLGTDFWSTHANARSWDGRYSPTQWNTGPVLTWVLLPQMTAEGEGRVWHKFLLAMVSCSAPLPGTTSKRREWEEVLQSRTLAQSTLPAPCILMRVHGLEVVNPIEVVKTRLQLQGELQQERTTSGFSRIYGKGKWWWTLKGITCSLLTWGRSSNISRKKIQRVCARWPANSEGGRCCRSLQRVHELFCPYVSACVRLLTPMQHCPCSSSWELLRSNPVSSLWPNQGPLGWR